MLSAEYVDSPFVPAYQVDNRFGFIEEKKVDKEQNKEKKVYKDQNVEKKVDEQIQVKIVDIEEEKKVVKEKNKEKKEVKEKNKDNKEQSKCNFRGSSKRSRFSKPETVGTCGHIITNNTLCFKCLEHNAGTETQEWLYNFLIKKDIHASYTFLKTCLVPRWC